MNRALVDRIANAVLYEGYILYPYRPSPRNRLRWNFGGLYPEAYCQVEGSESSRNQTQCLVSGTPATTIEAIIRFLHLTARIAGEISPPLAEWPRDGEPLFRPVEVLHVGDQLLSTWQEAEERAVPIDEHTLGQLASRPQRVRFAFPGGQRSEPVRDAAGQIVGLLHREQQTIEGTIEIEAAEIADGLYRLTCRLVNRGSWPLVDRESGTVDREKTDLLDPRSTIHDSRSSALLRTLVSAHTILGVRGGEFVSLLDPPEKWRGHAEDCKNVGVWPVLVGVEGQADTMLSAPIILYDYPQVAPESPGDFFDGTEIDEMLSLRILTLTEEEKRAMAAVDPRARGLLERTEAMAQEQLRGLHGTIRDWRPMPQEEANG